MEDHDALTEILTKATVPVWPTVGVALGMCRNRAYQAAAKGQIPTLRFGRKLVVPTGPLRRLLGIEIN